MFHTFMFTDFFHEGDHYHGQSWISAFLVEGKKNLWAIRQRQNQGTQLSIMRC